MAVRQVIKMGNPGLVMPAAKVSAANDATLQQIIDDMCDTMTASHAVGITAPQIGHSLRVIMFGSTAHMQYPAQKPIPFTVLINPIIEVLSHTTYEAWEGCLSVPGLRGLVARYHKICYHGYDIEGQKLVRIAEGLHARVVQHGCDHLDGIVYPMRIKKMQKFGFVDELPTQLNSDLICCGIF